MKIKQGEIIFSIYNTVGRAYMQGSEIIWKHRPDESLSD